MTALAGVSDFVRNAFGERVLTRANEAAMLDIEAIEDQNCFIPHLTVTSFVDAISKLSGEEPFNDDPNVRGRLGLRAGTTMQAWAGTLMEPFVIGSLWGNLSDNNQATLTSTGTTFRFQDNLQDVWGEVSAGVNFFNVSQTTSVFAKVDTTFGNDITGVGGKVGMRVAW